MNNRSASAAIYEKLCRVIPAGVNSPVRACKAMGQLPLVVESGYEDTLVDADGKHYIDYCCSWGALIHGHAHPKILDAVAQRMAKGTSFGATTSIEEQLARKVTSLIDSVGKIRFVSSGTEATMTAARLARGFTNREIIVKFTGNYHGHADFFLVEAGSGVINLNNSASSVGIPQDIVRHVVSLPYNDIESCQAFFHNPSYRDHIAAVILEPIVGNMGVVPGTDAFIHMLRDETAKIGALLIFDEVITGFRVGLKGAQKHYGISPDLTCFGKVIGGGFPAAAVGGRREIMDFLAPDGPVYQAGTLSGNPVAMEAGLQALDLASKPGFYEELQRKTDIITKPVQAALKERNISACIQQVGSMFTLFFGKTQVFNMDDVRGLDLEKFAHFFRFMFNNGVYIPPSQHEAWFVSSAHKEQNLEKTRDLILQFLLL